MKKVTFERGKCVKRWFFKIFSSNKFALLVGCQINFFSPDFVNILSGGLLRGTKLCFSVMKKYIFLTNMHSLYTKFGGFSFKKFAWGGKKQFFEMTRATNKTAFAFLHLFNLWIDPSIDRSYLQLLQQLSLMGILHFWNLIHRQTQHELSSA